LGYRLHNFFLEKRWEVDGLNPTLILACLSTSSYCLFASL
jgi:hypothetical protein